MYRTRFYLVQENSPAEITYAIKHCRQPKRTLAYKNLMRMLDQDKITSFGYYAETE